MKTCCSSEALALPKPVNSARKLWKSSGPQRNQNLLTNALIDAAGDVASMHVPGPTTIDDHGGFFSKYNY
jgi:hypothetical protein